MSKKSQKDLDNFADIGYSEQNDDEKHAGQEMNIFTEKWY
jgi:hypothetical protein